MRDYPIALITDTAPQEVFQPLEGPAGVTMGPGDGNLMPRGEVLRLASNLTAIINRAELRRK